MISLIGIGVDEGNISFNALKAIKDSDVIIKDVNFKPSAFMFDYIMVKDVSEMIWRIMHLRLNWRLKHLEKART